MKVITKTCYQATDGTAFDTQKDCEEYEAKLTKLSCLVNTKMSFSLVSSFIYNNYGEIKEIMEGKAEDVYIVSTEVNWSKVPAGTMILVRGSVREEWIERKFISYNPNASYPYVCSHYELGNAIQVGWTYAKLKS